MRVVFDFIIFCISKCTKKAKFKERQVIYNVQAHRVIQYNNMYQSRKDNWGHTD